MTDVSYGDKSVSSSVDCARHWEISDQTLHFHNVLTGAAWCNGSPHYWAGRDDGGAARLADVRLLCGRDQTRKGDRRDGSERGQGVSEWVIGWMTVLTLDVPYGVDVPRWSDPRALPDDYRYSSEPFTRDGKYCAQPGRSYTAQSRSQMGLVGRRGPLTISSRTDPPGTRSTHRESLLCRHSRSLVRAANGRVPGTGLSTWWLFKLWEHVGVSLQSAIPRR